MGEAKRPGPIGPATQSDAMPARRSRWWTVAVLAIGVTIGVAIVRSSMSSSVPVGASGPGSMPGMSMPAQGGGDRLELTMRDVEGRELRLPGGRPSVVVVANAGRCDTCRNAARAARDGLRRSAAAQLIVVMADVTTTRPQVAAFARSVGLPAARYVIDDRNGGLSSTIGGQLGETIVYDRRGRVVARLEPGSRQLAGALRRVRR